VRQQHQADEEEDPARQAAGVGSTTLAGLAVLSDAPSSAKQAGLD
jgi:hypothetical protein